MKKNDGGVTSVLERHAACTLMKVRVRGRVRPVVLADRIQGLRKGDGELCGSAEPAPFRAPEKGGSGERKKESNLYGQEVFFLERVFTRSFRA
jgi:hypothetical protein